MAGSYSFIVEPARDLVRMELRGFFEPAEVAAFNVARRAAYTQLTCEPNQHVTLVDMRGMHIQAQDAVTAFSGSLADPLTRSRKIAFVIAKSLARLQAKRAVGERDAEYFLDMEAAEDWLFS